MRALIAALLAATLPAQTVAQDDVLPETLFDDFDAFERPETITFVPVFSYARPNNGEGTFGLLFAYEAEIGTRSRYGFETFFARDVPCAIVDAAILGFGCNRAGSLNSYYLERTFADRNAFFRPSASIGLAYGDASSRPRKDGSKVGLQGGVGAIVALGSTRSLDVQFRLNTIDGFEQELAASYLTLLDDGEESGDGEMYFQVFGRSSVETESIGIGFQFKN